MYIFVQFYFLNIFSLLGHFITCVPVEVRCIGRKGQDIEDIVNHESMNHVQQIYILHNQQEFEVNSQF